MRVSRPSFVFLCAILSGCGSADAIIWSAKATSPDGQLIASASTTQVAGPGNNWVGTSVYLEQAKVTHPVLVLSFTNESAYPSGATAVTLNWLSNSQLDVIYKPGAKIEFQAIKALGISVTAHHI